MGEKKTLYKAKQNNANGKLIAPSFPRTHARNNIKLLLLIKCVVDFRFPAYFIYLLCTGVEH